MSSGLALFILLSYFGLLILVSFFTTRKHTNSETFYTANRNSPWYLVAFGMIGTSISGVTFVSIPGEVGTSAWTYFSVVMGNCIGYIIIGLVLLPLFYKLNLVSIYSWLDTRFNDRARLTGSFFFMVSQLFGASFRLFLVVLVLQLAFFDKVGIPFFLTVLITISLVWIYTYRGGVKTIVWTDTFQTVFMLTSVILTIVIICRSMQFNLTEAAFAIGESHHSQIFDFDWRSEHNTIKQILAGIAITIAINGLDQNMMQKTLTCRTLRDGKINMFSFSFFFLITNLLFLSLGALLYIFAAEKGITLPAKSDDVLGFLSINYFGVVAGVFFFLGITAAAYSSVDSSLTSLTISFCIDFLHIDHKDASQKWKRTLVHLSFSFLMFLVVVIFRELNDSSVVSAVFKAIGYTYGPILGLFAFGILTKYQINRKYLLWVCLLSPLFTWIINHFSRQLLFGYQFGFELLLLNGLLCFMGLWIIRERN